MGMISEGIYAIVALESIVTVRKRQHECYKAFDVAEELPYLSDTVTESPRDSKISQSTHDRTQ